MVSYINLGILHNYCRALPSLALILVINWVWFSMIGVVLGVAQCVDWGCGFLSRFLLLGKLATMM